MEICHCPFCKEKLSERDVTYNVPYGAYYMYCPNCGAHGPLKREVEEAVKAWNTRFIFE